MGREILFTEIVHDDFDPGKKLSLEDISKGFSDVVEEAQNFFLKPNEQETDRFFPDKNGQFTSILVQRGTLVKISLYDEDGEPEFYMASNDLMLLAWTFKEGDRIDTDKALDQIQNALQKIKNQVFSPNQPIH